ncbi:20394_t:CDS:2 [Entrophospora sp. SA101]|nr:5831_t:CDS:2 [Entrophospora sp. SA101]CAJ0764759.1 20394_t:CDS:2 [Entrophospora sp. SA101]
MSFLRELLKQDASISIYFSRNEKYNGEIKIWYYVVILLTLAALFYCFIFFKKVANRGPNLLLIDIFLTISWITSGITNLYPMYMGDKKLSCKAIGYDVSLVQHFYWKWCSTYFVAIVMSWITTTSFIMSLSLNIIFHVSEQKTDSHCNKHIVDNDPIELIVINQSNNNNNDNDNNINNNTVIIENQ